MDAHFKIVTQLPLTELLSPDGSMTATRIRPLAPEDITNLLRLSRVQFVVVDIGAPPRWISLPECYDFWKCEAQTHLAAPGAKVYLDECPDGYFYFASEWNNNDAATSIVVLEKYH